jgi:hypothetical protein
MSPDIAPHPHPKTMRFSRAQITLAVTALLVTAGLGTANLFKPGGPASIVNGPGGVGTNYGTVNNNFQQPTTRAEQAPKSPVGPSVPVRLEPSVAPPTTVTAEPTGVYKFVAQGLVKAREDLLSIKKEDLSCETLAQWQNRVSPATRLAHANNVLIHNPISQHVSACQNITNVELLDAMRMSVIGLLNRGVVAASAGVR